MSIFAKAENITGNGGRIRSSLPYLTEHTTSLPWLSWFCRVLSFARRSGSVRTGDWKGLGGALMISPGGAALMLTRLPRGSISGSGSLYIVTFPRMGICVRLPDGEARRGSNTLMAL